MVGDVVQSALHARIVSGRRFGRQATARAHAVLTGAELGATLWGRRIRDWPLLAVDRVRFVGDRLAIVAAETPAMAEAAVRAIEVEYEELPAVFDALEAPDDDAPILHPEGMRWRALRPGARGPRAVTRMCRGRRSFTRTMPRSTGPSHRRSAYPSTRSRRPASIRVHRTASQPALDRRARRGARGVHQQNAVWTARSTGHRRRARRAACRRGCQLRGGRLRRQGPGL